MTIIAFPRNVLQSAQWEQPGGRLNRQRSAFTGRGPELDFGTAARWTVSGDVVRTTPETRRTYAGFEAACQIPGARFRVPAVEDSQYGAADNLILNPRFEGGSAPWTLESAFTLIDTGAPVDFAQRGLYTDSTRAFNNALANAGVAVPWSAGQTMNLSTDCFVGTGSTGTLSLAVNFRNAGGSLISTLGANLVSLATPNQWQRVRATVTAPALTASAVIYFNNGLTAGFASVTNPRASLMPERALVVAGSSGRSLNLRGLVPSVRALSAGQFLTVVLPSGDEQLCRVTADVNASITGTATASLATPLREVPAADAPVELARPWGLMRATHTPGFGVEPGPVYSHEFSAEEAF